VAHSTHKLPKISLVIPAYNEAKFLEACLNSIFGQKVEFSFEVIVVDNNSQDQTAKIAKRWPVKLISELKPGASVARNTGAAVAQANLIYFLDADCRLNPGGLAKIYQAFLKNPKLEIVAGPVIYDLDGFFPKFATLDLKYFLRYHQLFKFCFGISQFQGGNFVIQKKLFNRVGRFDESICNQEIILPDDLDLAIRINALRISLILYDFEYAAYSSFRRVKRSPIRHTLIRFFATLDLLARKGRWKIKV